VVEDGDELTLQTLGPNGWADVYSFPPRPAFRIDIEVSNWWTCTNPASPFVRGLIVAVSHDDGRREALRDFSGPAATCEAGAGCWKMSGSAPPRPSRHYLPPIWGWATLVWMRKRDYM